MSHGQTLPQWVWCCWNWFCGQSKPTHLSLPIYWYHLVMWSYTTYGLSLQCIGQIHTFVHVSHGSCEKYLVFVHGNFLIGRSSLCKNYTPLQPSSVYYYWYWADDMILGCSWFLLAFLPFAHSTNIILYKLIKIESISKSNHQHRFSLNHDWISETPVTKGVPEISSI